MANDIRQTVQREYDHKQAQKERERDARIRKAGELDPKIETLLRGRTLTMTNAYTQALREHKLPDRNAIKAEYARMDAEIALRLKNLGLPDDYLQMQYDCPICKDRGYVGDADRHDCECFKKRIEAEKLKRSRLDMAGDDTFDKFDETIFPDENIAGKNYSQRGFMVKVRELCERYCDAFPYNKMRNMLLTGRTGLGKTFIVNCMANKLFARGVTVCYLTAYRMLSAMRENVMGTDMEPFNMMLNADVLIIDDLGSEPIYKNITIEMLFTLLNERIRARKHTVIATNLNADELQNRYGERVATRLLNIDETQIILFEGMDVRIARRKKD